jgi:hypothetical protein
VKKKLLYLSKNNFIPAFNLLSEKERYDIALNFFFTLKPSSIRELIKVYSNFENLRDKKLKIIRGWNEPKRLEEEISRYEQNSLSICLLLTRMGEPIKNKKKFERDIRRAFTHPETILAAKFTGDRRYICSSSLTKQVYYKIKRYKKPVKIDNLLSKFKTVRKKEVVNEFYRRGILLDNSIDWNTFLNMCRDLIKKGKFTKNLKTDWMEYDIEVFNTDGDYLEKEVILTKICREIDVKYYSPIKLI